MEFQEQYTTNEKIEAEKALPAEKQKEKSKTILSSDAFAVGSMVERLSKVLTMLIRSTIR